MKSILYKESKQKQLIPVHINKMRDDEYFWNWSYDLGDWVRGEKIPEHLKHCYKIPLTKPVYK